MQSTEQTALFNKKTKSKCYIHVFGIAAIIIICSTIYYVTSANQKQETPVSVEALRQKATAVNEVSITLHPDDIYHLEWLDTFGDDDKWTDYHSQIIDKHGYKASDDSVLYTFTMYDHTYDKEHYHIKYGFNDGTFMTGSIEPDYGDETSAQTPTPKPTRPKIERTPRPTKKGGRPPRPTQDGKTSTVISAGGMTCYFRYSLLENKNVPEHVLSCNEDGSILMGCIGGSTHRPKSPRSGELAVGNGCIVNGEAIYIRCCKPDEDNLAVTMTGAVSKVEYQAHEEFPSYSLNSFCQTTDLDGFEDGFEDNGQGTNYMTGCTGWMGTEQPFESSLGTAHNTMAEKMIGTKIVTNKFNQTNCKSHRGDQGFIAAAAIVVNIQGDASLECVTVDSSSARVPTKIAARNGVIHGNETEPVWGSMIFCPRDYNLMDCGAYTEDQMKECDHESTGFDKVNAAVFHGADLGCMASSPAHCSSSGYTDEIRVQARCCRIVQNDPVIKKNNYARKWYH